MFKDVDEDGRVPESTMEETYELIERLKDFVKNIEIPLENAVTL